METAYPRLVNSKLQSILPLRGPRSVILKRKKKDTSYFDSSWGGKDHWVGSFPGNFQDQGEDLLCPNQASWLELMGSFRSGRWQDSLLSLVNGMANFLQSVKT